MEILIDGKKPIYHIVMDLKKLNITKKESEIQDMADEYAIVKDKKANAGLIVYAKYNGVWKANPWSTRFLIKSLLDEIESLTTQKQF